MKTIFRLILAAITLGLLATPVVPANATTTTFYVAPNGNDAWSGTLPRPTQPTATVLWQLSSGRVPRFKR